MIPSEQSPASLDTEVQVATNLGTRSRWSVIRDGVSDMASGLGVTIAVAVVIVLVGGLQNTGYRSTSPLFFVEIILMMELSFLYFGFRRLKTNRNRGVTVNLLEGSARRGALSGISVGIGLIAVSIVYTVAVQKVLHLSSLPNPVQILREAKGSLVLSSALLLEFSILAPVCEELFFRANIFGSAQAINRGSLGVVVASALFAFAHGSLVLSPYYILFSLAMCWLFRRYRTIIGPIAAHMTVNSVACLAVLR